MVMSRDVKITSDFENAVRKLSSQEIEQLKTQGCTSWNWSEVRIATNCDLRRVQRVQFSGRVQLGTFDRVITLPDGLCVYAGVYNVHLASVNVGENALILNIRQGIRDYDVESEAVIVDVGSIAMRGESSFGNGQMINVLREDGELAMPIFDDLSSNVAHLLVAVAATDSQKRLKQMVQRHAVSVTSSRGRIGRGAIINGCGQLINVRIGPAARVQGSASLTNCSLNSLESSPITVGQGVTLRDSIVASGSSIETNAIVDRCFVGQCVRIDRQFSVQDSVIFANSEFSHGEASSLFAGPFSVSHHKSTLMIAAETSFFNAGSGASQCNHAYKTGPVHYGVLERGCKLGANSCLSWPARVGAFSTVLGCHGSGFDASEFPFSYIVESAGKTRLVPGLNLVRVGLWRDERMWIDRDRRTGPERLDCLHFHVLSSWTVEQMRRARDVIGQLLSKADRSNDDVIFAGMQIKHSDLVRGKRLYDDAIRCWLTGMAVGRLEQHWAPFEKPSTLSGFDDDLHDASGDWCDAGGMFVLRSRIVKLLSDVAAAPHWQFSDLNAAIREMFSRHDEDSWSWCQHVWRQELESDLTSGSATELCAAIEQWRDLSLRFLDEIVQDAEKDVATSMMWTHTPYAVTEGTSSSESSHPDNSLLCQLAQQRRDIVRRSTTLLQRFSDRIVPVHGA
ncbi:MAG: DUF4954 family protein [Fuerstiella sp.]